MPVGVEDELDGAGVDVADGPGRGHGGVGQPGPQVGTDDRRGASSTIFWWRRWMLHSRSNRATTSP